LLFIHSSINLGANIVKDAIFKTFAEALRRNNFPFFAIARRAFFFRKLTAKGIYLPAGKTIEKLSHTFKSPPPYKG
jgi:hypothetical protein